MSEGVRALVARFGVVFDAPPADREDLVLYGDARDEATADRTVAQ